MSRVLVCCAWPYANGVIHVGHVTGSILPADIFARFNRLIGNETVMVSGSDMHGAPITVSADKQKVSPETIANKYHEVNSKAIADLRVEFDLFTHTHTDNHIEVAREVFLKLLENGHLDRRWTPQFRCSNCDRFLPDRYVEGKCPHCSFERARGDQCDSCGMDLNAEQLVEAKCQLCGCSPELKETEHFFLKLSEFTPGLLEYSEGCTHWRPHVRQFTMNVLKEGLHDRPITRDISWGVPVPVDGFESKRIYVWFEAVIGYLSATREWAGTKGRQDAWRDFWADSSCRHYYFLGKDNIAFHTIMWPAILKGVGGLNLPYDVPANQFMNLGGQKFSKSMGISIDIPDILSKFRPDVVRYYLSANMPETKDSEFSWEDFAQRTNSELVATYGNFLHRALSFTYKNFGEIPAKGELDDGDRRALDRIVQGAGDVRESMSDCEFKRALKAVMDLAQFGNQYFDAVAPWSLVGADKARCGTVLHISLEICKALAVLAYPFMPESSEELWKQLCMDGTVSEAGWAGIEMPLNESRKMEKPRPLFAKVELSGAGEFAAFSALDLRVGRVVDVQDHPNADKLFVMKVDVGREITIVTGLKDFYTADELKKKTLVVVTNLEPASLRGVKSEGMLLAAELGDKLALLTPEKDLPAGTQVTSGLPVGEKRLGFKEFQKLDMRVGLLESASPPSIDVGGRKLPCSVEKGSAGVSYAAMLSGNRALVMSALDGTNIVLDKDMPSGAKIR